MARIRTIKPEFFDDEDIAAMSFQARLAYIGLWQQADREGRLRDRPVRLKARIFPFDELDMVTLLNELERCRFIRRYSVDGEAYIHVRTFDKHQQVNAKEAASQLPAPPPDSEHDLERVEHGFSLCGKEGKGKEQEGKGIKISPETVAAAVLLEFPIDGPGGPLWRFTTAHRDEFKILFPSLDIEQQARNALGWVRAKPGRQKTARGMKTFITGWFIRQTDRGGSHAAAAPRSESGTKDWRPTQAPWSCPHLHECPSRRICDNATLLNKPLKASAVPA